MKQLRISGRDGVFWRCGKGFPAHPDFLEVTEDTFTPEQLEIIKAEPNLIVVEGGAEDGNNTGGDATPAFPWEEGLGADRQELFKPTNAVLTKQIEDLTLKAIDLGLTEAVVDTIKPTKKQEMVSAIVWLEQFIADNSKGNE